MGIAVCRTNSDKWLWSVRAIANWWYHCRWRRFFFRCSPTLFQFSVFFLLFFVLRFHFCNYGNQLFCTQFIVHITHMVVYAAFIARCVPVFVAALVYFYTSLKPCGLICIIKTADNFYFPFLLPFATAVRCLHCVCECRLCRFDRPVVSAERTVCMAIIYCFGNNLFGPMRRAIYWVIKRQNEWHKIGYTIHT